MGLDMYLAKKLYVKQWSHEKPSERHSVVVKKGRTIVKDIKPERINYVTEEVMYWRKANAIHKWFVDNVQNGVDDCKEYLVSIEQLQALQDICQQVVDSTELVDGTIRNGYGYEKDGVDENGKEKWKKVYNLEKGKVMKDPKVAQELLPVQEGFFFGSYDYDKWYYEDVKRTAEGLKEILAEPNAEQADYYYQSSW